MPNQLQLADLELRIFKLDDQGYPIELTLNMEQEFATGFLDPAKRPQVALNLDNPTVLGGELFQWLLSDSSIRDAWALARGQHQHRRVRLRIDAEAPELHAVPWELLRDPRPGETPLDLAASADTPLSRYLSGPKRLGSPVVTRPLRVLVAVASPADLESKRKLSAIDSDAELNRIKKATNGLPVEVEQMESPCTLSRLEATLRQGRHHVLHLVCHGTFNKEKNKGALLLADDKGRSTLESEEVVAGMLARLLSDDHPLRLAFLMSCDTAKRSSGDAFRGMAPAIVRAGVPAVLAMQDKVPVETAQTFAEAFYRQLLDHGLVDLAVNEARSVLLSGKLGPAPSLLPAHAIPCLFMRLREGRLLGTRGRLGAGKREEQFWPVLLDNIADGCCIPILGPKVNKGLLPNDLDVAHFLAEKYDYPFLDGYDPVRVAQHVSLIDRESLRKEHIRCLTRGLVTRLGCRPNAQERRRLRRMSLSDVAEELKWSESVLEQETTLHHQLAKLELPLYLTTNIDPLMAMALRDLEPTTRQEGPRWTIKEGTPQWLLEPPASPDDPVVFHLFGHDGDEKQRQNMVFSEDDHFEHLVRLSRDQNRLLPSDVIEALSRNTYLLLGYDITDWSFRVLLQGLLKPIDRINSVSCHVGVQLDTQKVRDQEKARDYLNRYLGQHQFTIYWGSSQQFVTDLMERWQTFCEEEENGW